MYYGDFWCRKTIDPRAYQIKCVKIKCRNTPLYCLLGNSPASEFSGELPRRKHATFRTRRKFEIKNNFILLSIIGNVPWNTLNCCEFEQDLLIVSEMGLLFVGSSTIISTVS
jgi:hypothetical protein